MGVRKSNHRRCAVFDGVVADASLHTAGGTVAVVVQAIAGKGLHIGQIAGIQTIGDGDIVGRRAGDTSAAGLIDQGQTIDVFVVSIPVIGQGNEVGAGRPAAVK